MSIRVTDRAVRDLDQMVAAGIAESRADGIRQALDVQRRRQIGRGIADAYERLPQDDELVAVATAVALASIAEEPW